MRYIGIVKSGDLKNPNYRLTSESDSSGILDYILAGTGDKFISGYIKNVSNVYSIVVNFYSSRRESQTIILEPNQKILVKNQPCDRIQVTREKDFPFGLFNYVFQVYSAEQESELFDMIKRSELDITTSDPLIENISNLQDYFQKTLGSYTDFVFDQQETEEYYLYDIHFDYGQHSPTAGLPNQGGYQISLDYYKDNVYVKEVMKSGIIVNANGDRLDRILNYSFPKEKDIPDLKELFLDLSAGQNSTWQTVPSRLHIRYKKLTGIPVPA